MKVVAVTNTRKREELFQADLVIESMTDVCAEDVEKLLGVEV